MKSITNKQLEALRELKKVESRINNYVQISNKQYDIGYFNKYDKSDYEENENMPGKEVEYSIVIFLSLKMKNIDGKDQYLRIDYVETFDEEIDFKAVVKEYTVEEYKSILEEFEYYYN